MALGKWIGSALGWILSGGNVLGAIAGYCIGSLLSDATSTAERENGFNGNGNTFRNDYSDTQFNQRPFEEDRNSFLFSMLVLSSYIIKDDGRIMHSEMEFVRNFLRNNFGEQAVRQGEDILLKLFEMQKQQGATTFKETIRKSCVEISFHMNIGQRLQLLDYLIIIAKVDENKKAIPGTEIEYECDTLLLSVGLIPENDISRATGIKIDPRTNGPIVNELMETSIAGIFASGNVVHVHDLVDFVSIESRKAGKSAAKYIKGEVADGEYIEVQTGNGIGYTVPQKFRIENIEKNLELSMRVRQIYKNVKIVVKSNDFVIHSVKKNHMAPGEMEKITLSKTVLGKIDAKKIVVEVVEEDK